MPGKNLSEVTLEESIDEIVNLRIANDKELIESLNGLPDLCKSESLHLSVADRKTHQPDLETVLELEEIANCKRFLSSFRNLKDKVNGLHGELRHLNSVSETMARNLWVSKQNSRNLIDEIGKLESERKKLIKEKQLAAAYQTAFQLSPEDLKILRGTELNGDTLSPQFFLVFEKIQKIQSNVGLLMKIGHQTTAVEIMDQMSLFQESSLEKIYRWALSRSKFVENPEYTDVLVKSLSYLQIRPMLLKYVLDEYCTHRRSLFVRNFIDALTGVEALALKGIEQIGSSDPPRYVRDMLSWIHQAIPVENDNLVTMLQSCDKIDINERIISCLSLILDGICRPLNVRMEQTLLAGLPCLIMNQIATNILFYSGAIEKIVPGSNLAVTLKELHTLANQTFINQLKTQVGAEMGEYEVTPGSDLCPPSYLFTVLSLLKELVGEEGTESQELIVLTVGPLLGRIRSAAGRLGYPDGGVYIANCLTAICKVLSQLKDSQDLLHSLNSDVEREVDRLSSEQSSWLVAELGIGHLYNILKEKSGNPLSTVAGMDPSSLKIFVNKLDSLMGNRDSVLLPQLTNIAEDELRKRIQTQSFKIIIAIYKEVYEAVDDPKNLYPKFLLSLNPKTLEETLCPI